MKKRSLFTKWLLPAAMLALASCDKEELLNPTTTTEMAFSSPGAMLKKMQVSQINNNGYVYDFSYGSNDRPEKITGFYQSEKNEEGVSYKTEEEFILVYEGEMLKEVTRENTYTRYLADGTQEKEGGTHNIVYLYNENGLITEVQRTSLWKLPDNSGTEITFKKLYEYNKENRVIKITDYINGQKNDNYSTLEWNGGNLAKQKIHYENLEEERYEDIIFSEYDDKINPQMLIAVLFGNRSGSAISENNAGKIVNYSSYGKNPLTESQVTTIDITYDSKGRPVEYTQSLTVHELQETYVSNSKITYRD